MLLPPVTLVACLCGAVACRCCAMLLSTAWSATRQLKHLVPSVAHKKLSCWKRSWLILRGLCVSHVRSRWMLLTTGQPPTLLPPLMNNTLPYSTLNEVLGCFCGTFPQARFACFQLPPWALGYKLCRSFRHSMSLCDCFLASEYRSRAVKEQTKIAKGILALD